MLLSKFQETRYNSKIHLIIAQISRYFALHGYGMNRGMAFYVMVVVFTSGIIHSHIAIADIKSESAHFDNLAIENGQSSFLDFNERTQFLASDSKKDGRKSGSKIGGGEALSIEPIIKPCADKTDACAKDSASKASDYWITDEGQNMLLFILFASILVGAVIGIRLLLILPENPGYTESVRVHNAKANPRSEAKSG